MKKLNILAILLFVASVIAVFTLSTPTTRKIQEKVLAVFSPFIHTSAKLGEAVSGGVTAPPLNPQELAERNEQLRAEVQRLRIIAEKFNQVVDENNELRRVVEYRAASPFKLTAARVVKRSAATWWNTLLIDKGSLDGIGTDSPVITDQGLVGKTGKLAPHMAEVILLTDEMCRVSATVKDTSEQGVLSGERAGLDTTPNLHLRFLNRDAPVTAGALVYSSGQGGVFPANLLLGRVIRFQNRDISGEALVKPAVDFATLDHVFVIEMQEILE
jgi:rod shape-determining protein MreC